MTSITFLYFDKKNELSNHLLLKLGKLVHINIMGSETIFSLEFSGKPSTNDIRND